MGKQQSVMEEIKLALFDLSMNHRYVRRRELLTRVTEIVQRTIGANAIEFGVGNLRIVAQRMLFYGNKTTFLLKTMEQNKLLKSIKTREELYLVTDDIGQNANEKVYVIKVGELNVFDGYVLMTFPLEAQIDQHLLESLSGIVQQFIMHVFNNEKENTLRERSEYLFQLSSQLMGLNRTEEVLETMLESIRVYLPNNAYQIWMIREIENDELAVKQIDQKKILQKTPGFEALFYKKIEVKTTEDKKQTIVFIPFIGKREVSGMLEVHIPHYLEFEQSDFAEMEHFAKLIGHTIERTTMLQTSTKQIANLELINYTTRELNSRLDEHEIVHIIERQIINHSYPEQYAVVLKNEHTGILEVAAEKDTFFQHPIGETFMDFIYNYVERTERAMFYGDYNGESYHVPFRSIIAIPFYAENNTLGILLLAHSSRYYFSHDTYKLFQSLVQHASIALMNAYLKEQLKQTIITDYLTQLYSRNYLDSFVKHHMCRGMKGSFILFDIDDFKLINDTYGHYIGDHVLIEVANIIREHLKNDDISARWGGEEFAIYLPNVSVEESYELANTIREGIQAKTSPQVTVSGGVSEWNQRKKHSIESLFIEADEALYEAKKQGKNSIVYRAEKIIETNE